MPKIISTDHGLADFNHMIILKTEHSFQKKDINLKDKIILNT